MENIQRTAINLTIKTYISDYLTTLENEIMGTNNKVTELANAIYDQNRELFKFVFENISDEVNRQIWESKENKWVKEAAEKLRNEIEKLDKAKYKLGFAKKYISIKRNNQNIYLFDPRTKPSYTLEFSFIKTEDRQKIIDAIDLLLTQKKIDNKNNNNTAFTIKNFNEIDTNTLQEIHKIRFEIK